MFDYSLQEVQNAADWHICCGNQWHEEGYSTSGLGQWNDGIHNSVQYTRNCGGTEQIDGNKGVRVNQHVEETGQGEWQDIFEVITVGTENKFGYLGI